MAGTTAQVSSDVRLSQALRTLLALLVSAAMMMPLQPAQSAENAPATNDSVMRAMKTEMDRSLAKLKSAGEAPLYYLAYRIYDTETIDIRADYGGLLNDCDSQKRRRISVDLRVGSPEQDNTHKVRGGGYGFEFPSRGSWSTLTPIEDNEKALRVALWAMTDRDFKAAQKKYANVQANRDVKVPEEDTSADFSVESAHQFKEVANSLAIDKKVWEQRVRQLARLYRQHKDITNANVSFSATRTVRYLVSSEGAQIEDEHIQYRVFTTAATIADDGMRLWLYDGVESPNLADIPDETKLTKMVEDLASALDALRVAKVAEPYVGPAILRAKAAGVFFHETFGHRIEGHRQKNEDEGRTFAKKVGQKIMPDFITVTDDPTRQRLGSKPLNGYYKFDDEGVRAQSVTLVDKGVLKTFLMSRSPIKDFKVSNGHGRCSPGADPVARQANLIVESSKRVPYEKLREMLIVEAKRQGKPYGLIFDEIAGGFTMTSTFMPQVYKLLPLRVWRVYTDGRPDELLRGADLVGTPLASLERIMCGSDDDDTFNGTCGAESGWVPVSASAPSLLVDTIEVERQHKAQDKPPLLPPPATERGNNAGGAKEAMDSPGASQGVNQGVSQGASQSESKGASQ